MKVTRVVPCWTITTLHHQRQRAPRISPITTSVYSLYGHYKRFTHGHSCMPTTSCLRAKITPCCNYKQQWKARLDANNMRLNTKNTEFMECGIFNSIQFNSDGTVIIGGEDVKRAAEFKYLGSVIGTDGDLLPDIREIVNAALAKWQQVTGVL